MPIRIIRKEDCTGCGACLDSCPQDAIFWETDKEGFWYAKVDPGRCVDCSLCEKVCPLLHSDRLNETNIGYGQPMTLASYNTDDNIRKLSTSGGVFSALAEKVLAENGFIGGAVWTNDFGAKHILSDRREDLDRIRGSKYLQSDATGIYKQVKNALRTGRLVLICGTPCQMAGLRSFLQKDYDNLIIVDFICGNINSPKLFKKYIEALEMEYGGKMLSYHPKNKEYGGWHNFAFKATFDNGRIYVRNRTKDDFTQCFISTHIGSRPCCFECKFKNIPRIADLTIADFWGIENVDRDWDSPLGTSLVLLNNEKGQRFYESLAGAVVSKEMPLSEAIKGNGHLLYNSSPSTINRVEFYELLNQYGFRYAFDTLGRSKISFFSRIIAFSKKVFHKVKRSIFND